MKESVIYQDILEEGKREGLRKGKQEGLQEGLRAGKQVGKQEGSLAAKRQIAQNMLRSGLATAMVVELTGLILAEVEHLAQADSENHD